MSESVNQNRGVFPMRGVPVMLASRAADLFGVQTRQITQNIKSNPDIFTEKYAFKLTSEEWEYLRSSGVISKKEGRGGTRYLPWVLTFKGAIRLATLMKSEKAIEATDTFIDVFTEVYVQLQKGQDRIEISKPSRLLPTIDAKQVNRTRSNMLKAIDILLDTTINQNTQKTVRDELSEHAAGAATHLREILRSKKLQNEKVEAETLLVLEQAQDIYERRQSELKDAALDRELKHLRIVNERIDTVRKLLKTLDELEPNAIISALPNFFEPKTLETKSVPRLTSEPD